MAATQKRRRVLIAALAGVVAVGAFALVFTQISAAKPNAPAGPVASTTTAKAVVAAADINVGDQLTATNVALADYPQSALPAAGLYYADPTGLVAATWFSTAKLPKGQLVLATQVTQQLTPQKLPPVALADGNVAMSVPYDESKDAAGFIQQDDYIDILVDDPASKAVHYAFQGVHVARVGNRASQPTTTQTTGAAAGSAAPAPPAGATVLLVELPREQAAALAYAIDGGYTIRYLIRPHDQQTQSALPHSDPVGASNWLTVING